MFFLNECYLTIATFAAVTLKPFVFDGAYLI